VKLTEERSDVIKPRRRVNQSSSCIHLWRKPPKKILRNAGQCRVTLVQTTEDTGCHYFTYRTAADGVTKSVGYIPTRSGACGSWWSRRLVTDQIISVFAAISWRRFDRIYLTTWSLHVEMRACMQLRVGWWTTGTICLWVMQNIDTDWVRDSQWSAAGRHSTEGKV